MGGTRLPRDAGRVEEGWRRHGDELPAAMGDGELSKRKPASRSNIYEGASNASWCFTSRVAPEAGGGGQEGRGHDEK